MPGRDPHPLRGKVALITGVSRRAGIGYATAGLLAEYGASVFAHHFAPHDAEQPWGADDLTAVRAGLADRLVPPARLADTSADLAEPHAARALVDAAVAEFGRVDLLICNQAVNGFDSTLAETETAALDQHWAVDARASILLTQAFARQAPDGASVVLLTSGQQLAPMPGEIAYAAAKAALAGITGTLADELAERGIRLNTVNPGPVDTGYLTGSLGKAFGSGSPSAESGNQMIQRASSRGCARMRRAGSLVRSSTARAVSSARAEVLCPVASAYWPRQGFGKSGRPMSGPFGTPSESSRW